MLNTLKTNINEYAKDKSWRWYIPAWLFGVYLFIQIAQFNYGKQLDFFVSLAQAFDFFLHEMGHMFTSFLPPIFTASAGSMSELLLGALLIFGAFKGKTYFATMICSLWFMLTCQSAGLYMADARSQSIPLVTLSGEPGIHDWHYVFGQLGLLNVDTFIGGSVRAIGIIAGVLGLIFSAWLIYKMMVAKPSVEPSET